MQLRRTPGATGLGTDDTGRIGVLRVQRDLGKQSNVGLFLSDRRVGATGRNFGERSARVVDEQRANFRVLKEVRVRYSATASRDRLPIELGNASVVSLAGCLEYHQRNMVKGAGQIWARLTVLAADRDDVDFPKLQQFE